MCTALQERRPRARANKKQRPPGGFRPRKENPLTTPDTIPDAAHRGDHEPRLSASRLSLAAACPGSFALTHDKPSHGRRYTYPSRGRQASVSPSTPD